MTHMFKEPLIISTEGDTKFIKYNAINSSKQAMIPKSQNLRISNSKFKFLHPKGTYIVPFLIPIKEFHHLF